MPSHATSQGDRRPLPVERASRRVLLVVRVQPPRPSPHPPRPVGRATSAHAPHRRRTRTRGELNGRGAPSSATLRRFSRMSSTTDAVRIFDTTLRDGEQSPGIALNAGEKVEIARQLERLGVDIIEAGFAISSPGEVEGIREVGSAVGCVVASLARTNDEDIDAAIESLQGVNTPRIHTFIATSDIHMEHKLRMTREQVLESAGAGGAARQVRSPPTSSSRARTRRVPTSGLHGRGRARGDRRRRDHHQHPRHRRLHGARGVRRDPAAGCASACPSWRASCCRCTATTTWAWRSPTRWPASRPAPARSSARSTASASGRATPRSRRS